MSAQGIEDLHPNSLAAQDHASEQAQPPEVMQWSRQASIDSGRGPSQMEREILQAGRWPGQMSTFEYLSQRLYLLGKGERKEFLSEWLHWPIEEIVNDPEFARKTTEKWTCTNVLEDNGVATIPISIMVDPAGESYGDTPVASDPDQLIDFLSTAQLPIFAKPNNLLGSFGAFRIEAFDGQQVTLHNGESWPVDVLIDEVMSGIPYVLAPVISNHDQIAEFADGLVTVRTVNFVSNEDVRIGRAVVKIPVAGQIADNLWRSGNLAANVDPETGVIDRVVRGAGPELTEFTEHPDTGVTLVGMALPHWEELRALDVAAARSFPGLSYQSQDIAITNNGPLVVEVNSGGSFALPQLTSGSGLLTEENRKFFEGCGVNFRTLENPRFAAA